METAEDRKDVPALPEECRSHPNPESGEIRKDDGPHSDSEPAKVSELDLTSRSREKAETEIPAPDPDENLDLEQETEID